MEWADSYRELDLAAAIIDGRVFPTDVVVNDLGDFHRINDDVAELAVVGSRRATGRCSPVTKVRRPSTDPVGTGSSAGCGRRSHCTRRTSNGRLPRQPDGSVGHRPSSAGWVVRAGQRRWTAGRPDPGHQLPGLHPVPVRDVGARSAPGGRAPDLRRLPAGRHPASGQRRSRWARPGRRGHRRTVPETVRGRRGCPAGAGSPAPVRRAGLPQPARPTHPGRPRQLRLPDHRVGERRLARLGGAQPERHGALPRPAGGTVRDRPPMPTPVDGTPTTSSASTR